MPKEQIIRGGRNTWTMKEIGKEYGVHFNTMAKWIYKNDQLVEELAESHWSSRQLFRPIHREIIHKYFGKPIM